MEEHKIESESLNLKLKNQANLIKKKEKTISKLK